MSGIEASLETEVRERLTAIGAAHEVRWVLEELSLLVSPSARIARAQEILRRREEHEPLAYVLGHWAFREFEFFVGPGTLIPRPETEELVEYALSLYSQRAIRKTQEHEALVIADFGAGSGCIGLSFAIELRERFRLEGSIELYLVERSPNALVWLRKNVDALSDRLQGISVRIVEKSWSDFKEKVDVLLSNPPYITLEESRSLEKSVASYEPWSALVPEEAEQDPLATQSYREILKVGERVLKPSAMLGFELGLAQVEWIGEAAAQASYLRSAQTLNDMSGRPRFFFAFRAD